LGVGVSARIMQWTTVARLTVIAVLVFAGVPNVLHHANRSEWSLSRIGPGALTTAVIGAFFAFGGWWELGRMVEEVKSPRRTMPRALLGGVALVAAMYALLIVAFMLVTAASPVTDEAFVAAVSAAVFGTTAARVLPAMVVVAVSGTLASVLLRSPRGYLAMARDGIFPERLATFNQRRGTAPASTFIQVLLACVLAPLGTFDQILGYFVPAVIFFVGLAAATVLRFPRPDDKVSVFRMPWYPLPLVLFLAMTLTVLIVFCVGHFWQTLAGGFVIGLVALASRVLIAGMPESRPRAAEAAPAATGESRSKRSRRRWAAPIAGIDGPPL